MKQYLGDAVYAEIENGMIKLRSSNGRETTNVIFLEYEIYLKLVEFVNRTTESEKTENNLEKTDKM